MDEGTGRVEEKTDRPLHWSVVRRESRPSITLAGVNILYQVRIVIIIVKNSQTFICCSNASASEVVFPNFGVSFLVLKFQRHNLGLLWTLCHRLQDFNKI